MPPSIKHSRPWLAYKPGATNSKGEVIDQVHFSNGRAVVYTVKDSDERIIEADPSIRDVDYYVALSSSIRHRIADIFPTAQYRSAENFLDSALFQALSATDAKKSEEVFAEAIDYVDSIWRDVNQSYYVFFAMTLTFGCFIPPLLFVYLSNDFSILRTLTGAAFGSLGALISLLQRFSTIQLPKYASWHHTFLRATARIFIGYVFGSLVIIMNSAGLLLNAITVTNPMLWIIAFVAGLTERLVPDLLTSSGAVTLDTQSKPGRVA